MQGSCQVLQPRRLQGYIIVRKCEDIALRLPDPSIAGVGQPLLGFEQVTIAAGIPVAEFIHDLSRLIVRIVIHNQDFPRDGFRQD
jgi:hypothetical protein